MFSLPAELPSCPARDEEGWGRSEGLKLGSRYDPFRSWAEVCDGKVKNAWETR